MDSLFSYDFSALSKEDLYERLKIVDDQRIWVIAEALRKGITYEEIHDITMIDLWFIDKIQRIVEMEDALKAGPLTLELLKEAKRIEFPDNVIARLTGKKEAEIKEMRYANGTKAVFKMVDTCAAEFAASTPYYYSCIGGESETNGQRPKKKLIVI